MKLYYNAKFWYDGNFENQIKGLLIQDGKIYQIIRNQLPKGNDIQAIDLKGSYVYPGFIDTHTHSFEGGLYSLMTDLSAASSLDDVFQQLEMAYKNSGDYMFAWNFDETKIAEKRFPTRAELDKIVSDKNLVLRRVDGHSCIVNDFACKSILNGAKKIHCDDEVFKGFENDKAVHWFHNHVDDELIYRAYQAAAQIAVKGGFTTIHTMVGDANMSVGHYEFIQQRLADFPIDFVLYPQSFNMDAALKLNARRIGGCILADGSIGSLTAAVFEPYSGKPIRGNLYQSDQFWLEFISKAHANNLQVAVHCIGDRAISQINNAYAEVNRKDPKDLRHQLIHCEITDDDLIQSIAQSQAVPVMQPMFDALWGGKSGFYARLLGVERSRNMNRFASMLNSGIKITGSSDWYITELDIRKSLQAAMNHHYKEESLSLMQAIDIYTKNAAWLSHDENIRGQIKAGLDADFTIMNYIPGDRFEGDNQIISVIKRGDFVL